MNDMETSVRTANAARPLRGRLAAIAFGIALACGAVDHSSAQELMLPQSLSDLVAESDFIAIADVVSAQARRNSRGNLIVTDYRFRVSETLEGAAPGTEFVLTQGGGTLAGETHQLSDAADLSVGQRYLIFVRPGTRRSVLAVRRRRAGRVSADAERRDARSARTAACSIATRCSTRCAIS